MSRISRLFLIMSCFACGFLVTAALAEETVVRHYSLPDHGNLRLQTPVSWKDDLRQPPHRLPPTIDFKPGTGKPFEILITPIWPMGKDMTPPSAEGIQALVKRVAEHAKPQAVERDINLKELKGPSGIGYYFFATDRAPKPDEYKYMTQGAILVGDIALAFTILTNDGQDSVITDALSMLKSAAHAKDDAK